MTDRRFDPALRAELLQRAEADKAARRNWLLSGPRDWPPVDEVDKDNLAFLTQHIERHGWLDSDLVGTDGAHACWQLVRHAPGQQQAEWLPLLHTAAANGRADQRDRAYLQDRVDMHQNRHQAYGTQSLGTGDGKAWLWPLKDPDRLHERRAEAGLPPLDEKTVKLAWKTGELAFIHNRHLTDNP